MKLEKLGSSLEFRLHRLHYLHLLQLEGRQSALAYARRHFDYFGPSQIHGQSVHNLDCDAAHSLFFVLEIQRLMGCLVFVNRIQDSPYKSLFSPSHWRDIEYAFARESRTLLGLSHESPLFVRFRLYFLIMFSV